MMNAIVNNLKKQPITEKTSINNEYDMPKTFQERQQELEENLNHAFRYGSSAFRLGLIPESISDHLPITVQIPLSGGDITMLSWNLLADEHLFNNFMNISGSLILQDAINEKLGEKENIYNDAMYHLFAELAQFLYAKMPNGASNITIDAALLNDFVPNSSQPSRRALSRIAEVAKENLRKVEAARSVLVEIFKDLNNPNIQEYQLAIKHSLELIYHIKNPNGALKWENRLARLKENETAIKELVSQDLLALQECTSPADIKSLFEDNQSPNKEMIFISHNISNSVSSTDNVVLAYDQKKFILVDTVAHDNPLKTDFEGKKPAIFCKLKDLASGQIFIVGSVHHPGGDNDLRHEIVDTLRVLQGDEPNRSFFIAGDYNHTAEQFANLNTPKAKDLPPLFYPTDFGTMAGSDFGNTNKSIDAIMSSADLVGRVAISSAIKLSPPAHTPITIDFKLSAHDKKRSEVREQKSSSPQTVKRPTTLPADKAKDKRFSNMKNNILMAIIIAKDHYLQKKYRPGYPQTVTDLALKEKFADIEKLYAMIDETDESLIALNYLIDQLTDEQAHWGDYDFNNYIIDALKMISRDAKQSIATIDWDCFTPKAVKRFEGVVYRGTSSPPEKIFNQGFTDYVPSSDLTDYTEFRNLSTGVSTSRSYDLAEKYTRVASRQGKSRFVYTILYRGIGAVDIIETAKARGIDLYSMTNPQATKALEKDEINIIDKIPAEQILYATEFLADGRQIIHKNPNYNGQYRVDNINYASARPTNESGFLRSIYNFFAEVISFLKVLSWYAGNQEKINHYGIDYRHQEIEQNALMQEAEILFENMTNAHSFELISAHLSIDAPITPVITSQPDDAKQIKADETTTIESNFELINDIETLSELITLKPSRSARAQ